MPPACPHTARAPQRGPLGQLAMLTVVGSALVVGVPALLVANGCLEVVRSLGRVVTR